MTAMKSLIGFWALALFTCCSVNAENKICHDTESLADTPFSDTASASVLQTDSATGRQENRKKPEVKIEKALLYDKYTLADTYAYGKKKRSFQWEKIKERLERLEAMQDKSYHWGILRNYKDLNGQAPLAWGSKRNEYGRMADSLGTERYQGIPLYELSDTLRPALYGRDGNLVRILKTMKKSDFLKVQTVYPQEEEWLVPSRYVKSIGDTVRFEKAIFIDRHNQNIATLEKSEDQWLVRSMNPATTGRFKPPYAQPTPLGLFVVQQKKSKMVYLKDGSKEVGGFAPYANRFTCGAYIHGVPVVAPQTEMTEYSYSLGTTPRSHMCVRNVTSHSKFIYNWGSINTTVVFVLE